jgi:agmatine/peptidylarginine deiminase
MLFSRLFTLFNLLIARSYLPAEFSKVNTLVLSIDDMTQSSSIYTIWKTLIELSQEQNIEVIIYLVKYKDNLIRIKNELGNNDFNIDIDRIKFIDDYRVNTIWVRDYSPFVSTKNKNFISFEYLYHRPLDNAMPSHFANMLSYGHIKSDIRLEGGNIHTNGAGFCVISDKVIKMNHHDVKRELTKIGCIRTLILKSLYYDATQHVDIYILWIDKDTILMGFYNETQDFKDYYIMLENYRLLKDEGFTIISVPMPSHCANVQCNKYVSRTYLNAIFLNKYLIVPVYEESKENEEVALNIIREQLEIRGKSLITVPGDHIITYSGSVHCISKTFYI